MRKLLSFLLLVLSLPLAAQAPYLVKDINTTTLTNPKSSSPRRFFKFGSRIYFAATDSSHGEELYSTDGTAAGTSLFADLAAGTQTSAPQFIAIVNGRFLFNTLPAGKLWASDGTVAGTQILSNYANSPIVYRGKLYYTAVDDTHGFEMWVSDGTVVGTHLFKDIVPGTADSAPDSYLVLNDTLYFRVANNSLWKSDGTDAGTVVFKSGNNPFFVTLAGSHFFFYRHGATQGHEELWVSDGTDAGTKLLGDFVLSGFSAFAQPLFAFGDRVLFGLPDADHGYEPWVSDGTVAGTHVLRDIVPGPNSSNAFGFVTAGAFAYFAASTTATGSELWKTDGTEAGTVMVSDIRPGTSGSGPNHIAAIGDRVIFAADTGELAPTVWISDGTAAGTKAISASGVPSLDPTKLLGSNTDATFTVIDGVAYFSGGDHLHGYEPWKTDGTTAGTSMIASINADAAPSSGPNTITAAGDWVYFNAWDGSSTSTSLLGPDTLWRSDGTPEGTVQVGPRADPSTSTILTAGRSEFFGNNLTLWRSDGTPESTNPAYDFTRRFPQPAAPLFVLGDTILATGTVANKAQLWATPSALGATTITALAPVNGSTFVAMAGRVYFFAPNPNPATGTGLWSTDGTVAGTRVLVSLMPAVPSFTEPPVVMGGALYFELDNTLWKTDGTLEGTVSVKTFPSSPHFLTPAGKNLFFTLYPNLWVTDGTPEGTRSISSENVNGPLAPVAGDKIVFKAGDLDDGGELYVSDGTPAGTHVLSKLNPLFGSYASFFMSTDGLAYFSAVSAAGTQPWVTDGTPEGTVMLGNIDANSSPANFTRAGDKVFFRAFSQSTGFELWAVPFPSNPRLSIADTRASEGNAGNGTVRFTVTLTPASTKTVTVDYATSDGSASATSDYDSRTGTLTFAPGETSKTIDVAVHGDAAVEGNESFFLTLRNATNAAFARTTAFAIIDDDDRSADVSVALDYSQLAGNHVQLKVKNDGPQAANNLALTTTNAPLDFGPGTCIACTFPVAQLAAGATRNVDGSGATAAQGYFSATIAAADRDPQMTNNTVAWTQYRNVAMDALYLTPGAQANVTFANLTGTVNVTSSNPSVLTVPATLTASGAFTSFVVRAAGEVGTSLITITPPAGTPATLLVTVVAAGSKAKISGAFNALIPSNTTFDKVAAIVISERGGAPFTGERSTGVVTISSNGQELGRATLNSSGVPQTIPVYMPKLGANTITVDYAGDANFAPVTKSGTITATIGSATITVSPERNGTTETLHVAVTGSPLVPPSGTVTISETGVISATTKTLDANGRADFTLPNFTYGTHTLSVAYSGDARHNASTQSVRVIDGRRHTAGH